MLKSRGRSVLDAPLSRGMTSSAWDSALKSNRLPRIWHRCGQAAIDRDRLAVDVRRLVACQKQSHRRELVRLAGALQGVELADLAVGAARLGVVEDWFGHAGFDQARTHRVDAHASAGQ